MVGQRILKFIYKIIGDMLPKGLIGYLRGTENHIGPLARAVCVTTPRKSSGKSSES